MSSSRWLRRIEFLFPVRGRWLKYLLAAIGLFLSLFLLDQWFQLRDVVSTLPLAQPGSLRLELVSDPGAEDRRDSSNRPAPILAAGPLRLSWSCTRADDPLSLAVVDALALTGILLVVRTSVMLVLPRKRRKSPWVRHHPLPGSPK